jgi:hypothetical protein
VCEHSRWKALEGVLEAQLEIGLSRPLEGVGRECWKVIG